VTQVSLLGELNELLQATQDLNESIMHDRGRMSPRKKEILPRELSYAIASKSASPEQVERATRFTVNHRIGGAIASVIF